MSDKKIYEYKDVPEAAKRWRELRDLKDALEEQLSAVNNEIGFIDKVYMPKEFENQEIEKITIEGAGTIYLQGDVYVSMTPAEDKEFEAPFYDWAREKAPELIVPYIHPARLKSWTKEVLEKGLPYPSNMLKVTPFTKAVLRRK